VTVTVTETVGAANTGVVEAPGATATDTLAATITQAPALSTTAVDAPQTPDITSLVNALPTFAPAADSQQSVADIEDEEEED
jgi:hypothetical protein